MSIAEFPLDRAQVYLDQQQAIPVIGFTIFSPLKAGLSIVQTIYGLAKSVFFGFAASISNAKPLQNNGVTPFQEKCLVSLHEAERGVFHLGSSLINIFTLGLFGYKLEKNLREHNEAISQAMNTVNQGLPLLKAIFATAGRTL